MKKGGKRWISKHVLQKQHGTEKEETHHLRERERTKLWINNIPTEKNGKRGKGQHLWEQRKHEPRDNSRIWPGRHHHQQRTACRDFTPFVGGSVEFDSSPFVEVRLHSSPFVTHSSLITRAAQHWPMKRKQRKCAAKVAGAFMHYRTLGLQHCITLQRINRVDPFHPYYT